MDLARKHRMGSQRVIKYPTAELPPVLTCSVNSVLVQLHVMVGVPTPARVSLRHKQITDEKGGQLVIAKLAVSVFDQVQC